MTKVEKWAGFKSDDWYMDYMGFDTMYIVQITKANNHRVGEIVSEYCGDFDYIASLAVAAAETLAKTKQSVSFMECVWDGYSYKPTKKVYVLEKGQLQYDFYDKAFKAFGMQELTIHA